MENSIKNSETSKRSAAPINTSDVTSNSVSNSGNIQTKTLNVDSNAYIGGKLSVEGSASIAGGISTDGNITATSGSIQSQRLIISKANSNILSTDDAGNVKVYKNIDAQTATFSYNTYIGSKKINDKTTEGCVQATNLIAGSRLCVGTGNQFVIDDQYCKFGSNKYTGYFGELIVDGDSSFNSITVKKEANIQKLTVMGESILKNLVVSGSLNVNTLKTMSVSSESLNLSNSITAKTFTFTNGGDIGASLTIHGANSDGYGLSVNGGSIIANKGIRAYNGLNEFGCLKINGQDKKKCKIAGTEYGLWVADEVPSLFKGDVYINDSNMVFDNSALFASDITVLDVNSLEKNKRYSNLDVLSEGLQIVANTADNIWSTYKSDNLVETDLEFSETSFDEVEPILVDEMDEEFNAEWNSGDEEIEKTVKGIDSALLNKLRQVKRCDDDCDDLGNCFSDCSDDNSKHLEALESNFELKDGKYFRIDSGGHAFLKEVVAEDATFSTVKAHDFVATNFNTKDIRCDKLQTNESLGSLKAFYARGISRFTGKVYNYADNYFKHAARITLQDKAKMVVDEGASIEIGSNATFKTDSLSTVKLDGNITLNIDKLILKDNAGHSIKLTLKTVSGDSDEGEAGEIVLGYQETL